MYEEPPEAAPCRTCGELLDIIQCPCCEDRGSPTELGRRQDPLEADEHDGDVRQWVLNDWIRRGESGLCDVCQSNCSPDDTEPRQRVYVYGDDTGAGVQVCAFCIKNLLALMQDET